MGRNVSIEISAREDFSQTVTTMRNSNQAFNKDLEETQRNMGDFLKKQDALDQMKKKMQTDLDDASNSLKKAKKAFAENNNEINRTNLEKAHENYNKVSNDLKGLNTEAKDTQKSIRNLSEEQSKAENKAGSGSSKSFGGSDSVLSRLGKAGLTKMMGDSLSGVTGAYISSAFNNETGNMVSSVLGGITNGAALGTAVAPGVGTAVGAAVGAASGAIDAAAKTFTDKDNAFKGVVQEQYKDIKNTETSDLQSGITTASEREGDLRAFTTLLGSADDAEKFQKWLVEAGRTPPFDYETVTALSKEMIGLGDSTSEAESKISNLGEAASALGWSGSEVESISSTLDAALANGNITSRVLKTLDRNGLNAEEAISEAFKIKKSDVDKKIGSLNPQKVIDALYKYMGTAPGFKGASAAKANTYEGLKGIADSYNEDQQAAVGAGYENVRKTGLSEHNTMMGGAVGKDIKEANTMLGQFQGDLENTKEELIDNAKASVVSGTVKGTFADNKTDDAQIKKQLQGLADDYKAQIAKAKTGDLEARKKAAEDVEEATIVAGNAYKLSKGYKLEEQGNLDLIQKIQDDDALKDTYWNTGYIMGEKFSSGLAKAQSEDVAKGLEPDSMSTWSKLSNWAENSVKKQMGIGVVNSNSKALGSKSNAKVGGKSGTLDSNSLKNLKSSIFGSASGRATGLFRVPYNNYPAILHEGETVNTAVEARSQKSGGIKIEINGPVTVRKESDIDEIASKLYQKLKRADMVTP